MEQSIQRSNQPSKLAVPNSRNELFRPFEETLELEKGYLIEPSTARLSQELVEQATCYSYDGVEHEPPELMPNERFHQATYNGDLLIDTYASQYGNIIKLNEKGKSYFPVQTAVNSESQCYFAVYNGHTMDGTLKSTMRVHKLVAETWLRKPQYWGYEFETDAEIKTCDKLIKRLDSLTLIDDKLIEKRDKFKADLEKAIKNKKSVPWALYEDLQVHHLLPKLEPLPKDFNYAVNLAWTYLAVHNTVTDWTKKFQVIEPDGTLKEFRTAALLAEYYQVSEGLIVNLLEDEPPEVDQSMKHYITALPPISTPQDVNPCEWKRLDFFWILNRPMTKRTIKINGTRALIKCVVKWLESMGDQEELWEIEPLDEEIRALIHRNFNQPEPPM